MSFSLPTKKVSNKLMAMNLLSIALAFLLMMLVVAARDIVNFKELIVQDLVTKARIISTEVVEKLEIKDSVAIQSALNYLKDFPQIETGVVFDEQMKLIASFSHKKSSTPLEIEDSSISSLDINYKFISLFEPIYHSRKRVGSIYLVYSFGEIYSRLVNDYVLLTAIVSFCLLFCSALFALLQNSISGPIQAIIKTMHKVTKEKNYSYQVEAKASGELETLIDEFNSLLQVTHQRNKEIQDHRTNLEGIVLERTSQLEKLNDNLENELTARRRTEKELLAKSTELAKTSDELKFALKAEKRFLATMSHEMRTPLNAVIGFLEVLLTTDMTEYQFQLFKNVKTSADHLLALICDILDVSKIDCGQMVLNLEPIDLKAIADECAILAGSRVQKNVEFRVQIPDFEFSILGDSLRIKQIFLNILGNSAKFTEKGFVAFSLFAQENLPHDKVSLKFLIEDTGPGIPEEKMRELFLPFRQLNHDKKGTGLGLYISKALTEMMDGHIEIFNKPEGGLRTILSFRFEKCTKIICDKNARNKELYKQDDFKKLRILLVEDMDLNIMVAQEVFAKFIGIKKLDVAKNGQEALSMVREKQYDLCFMDVQMPIMDGIEATKKIRAEGYSFPVIAMSANAFLEEIEIAKRAGMNDYITKPFKPENIFYVLKNFQFGEYTKQISKPEKVMVSDSSGSENCTEMQKEIEEASSRCKPIFDYFLNSFGDKETADRLYKISEQSISENLEIISQGIKEKKYSQIRAGAHKLNGLLLNCGLTEMAKIVAEIQTLAKKNMALEKIDKDFELIREKLGF